MNKTYNLLIVVIGLVAVTWIFKGTGTQSKLDTRDVVFSVGKTEMIRLALNGDFLVRGKVVVNDVEVYKSFKNWVRLSNQSLAKNKFTPTIAPPKTIKK